MFLNRKKKWGAALKSLPLGAEKLYLYILIFIVPLLYYPLNAYGQIDLRKIREIGFYSFAIIICSFLQKSRWLRYFIIWCVINWWANFFYPTNLYVGLTNVFSALVIYIGVKYLLKNFLKVDTLLRIICFTVLFQFVWLIFQMFDYSPLAWWKYKPGFYAITATGTAIKGATVPLVSWSGNPSVLGVFFAINSFLLLHFFKIKKFSLFFIILTSIFVVKNATTVLTFGVAGLFYLLVRYRFKLKTLLMGGLLIIGSGLYFIFIKGFNLDRLPIWQKLITDGIKIRPIMGKGLNFFSHLYIVDKTGTPWREAHNDYLQMILELGIVGFVLFAGFIVSIFVVFFREKRDNKQICIMSCIVGFLVSAVSLFPMHLAQLSFYAIILLATLEATYGSGISTKHIG